VGAEKAPNVAEVARIKGQFPQGVSGNPSGRPKGSKNKITLLKQTLELELREQASEDIGAVLRKATELALEGHAGMIKMLVELHMSKTANDDVKGSEKVAIQINSAPPQIAPTVVVIDEPTPEEQDNE
jgi:hypothetical protein